MPSEVIEEPRLEEPRLSIAVVPSNAEFDEFDRPTVDENPPETPTVRSWTQLAFFLVNVWLVFHLFAIVVCPASVEPSSPLIQSAFFQVSPYLHLLYLDHGFHFFAPEPGASTLVSYQLVLPDGSTKTGQFPNRSISPRLLYHRHFMLTEFLGNGPEELEPLVARAMARNLCRQTGAVQVTLTKVEHFPPGIEDIEKGRELNDPQFFNETPIGTFTPEELKLPYQPREVSATSTDSPAQSKASSNPPKDTP